MRVGYKFHLGVQKYHLGTDSIWEHGHRFFTSEQLLLLSLLLSISFLWYFFVVKNNGYIFIFFQVSDQIKLYF